MNERSPGTSPRQVVAIGASAGGVSALQAMLPELPSRDATAYLLVVHSDPEQPSYLDEILQRLTDMRVAFAADEEPLQPDRMYLLPPGQEGGVRDGRFALSEEDGLSGGHHTVDILFETVAREYGPRSIGVVLSGSGSDGLEGARAIKAAEGIVIAQDPESAGSGAMPAAVIDRGLADVVTDPASVGRELTQLETWPAAADDEEREPSEDNMLPAIVGVLARKTGIPFEDYKEGTLRRRIRRRQFVTRRGDPAEYLEWLRESPDEAERLKQDVLISVTELFRDPEAFDVLADAIRELIRDRQGEAIRVWVPGCATGEEAYSIGMLIADAVEASNKRLEAQIFATDIDETAIRRARRGVFLATAVDNVPERLREKYLIRTDGAWRVRGSLREMVTFATHDLLQDPPFARLDLIACRNVLIYLKQATQERLLNLFHYSLNPSGLLMLGESEGIGYRTGLFDRLVPNVNIFRRRERSARIERPVAGRQPRAPRQKRPAGSGERRAPHGDIAARLGSILFDRYMPPCALVDRQLNVIYTHGDTARFMHLPAGGATLNILELLPESLRLELRLLLSKLQRSEKTVRSRPVTVETEQGRETVRLIAMALEQEEAAASQTLVVFEPLARDSGEGGGLDESAQRREADEELAATRDLLLMSAEELGEAREELLSLEDDHDAATEALQTSNEELQATNEELQSSNEELNTLNEELRTQSEQLAAANRDLESILDTVASAVVVLDADLRITRYSASSRALFDAMPISVGKPLEAVGGVFDADELGREIARAFRTAATVETQIDADGRTYLVRIVPQIEEGGEVSGLVVSFVEATRSLRDARAARRLAAVLRESSDAVTAQTPDGRILAWNRGAERLYGYSESEALAMDAEELLAPGERQKWQHHLSLACAGEPQQNVPLTRRTKDGHEVEVAAAMTALSDETGQAYAVGITERDLRLLREAEAGRREAQLARDARITTAGELAAGLAHELNQPITACLHFCDAALSIARKADSDRAEELEEILTDASAEARRAGDIIGSLRRFLSRRGPVRKPRDLNRIVRETIGLVQSSCVEKGIRLRFSAEDDLPAVPVDDVEISQVVLNLLRNAMEALEESAAAAGQIHVASSTEDHSVLLSVRDNARGAWEGDPEVLFEPFYTTRPEGLGMGLWISRSIAEAHDGRLWAEDSAGSGLVFKLRLPAADNAVEPER